MPDKVVIDRFEGKFAILLVGEKPVNVLRTEIPEEAKEGDWLEVEFDGKKLVSAKIDLMENEQMKERIKEKLEKLRRKSM
jgi:hypothetical protein